MRSSSSSCSADSHSVPLRAQSWRMSKRYWSSQNRLPALQAEYSSGCRRHSAAAPQRLNHKSALGSDGSDSTLGVTQAASVPRLKSECRRPCDVLVTRAGRHGQLTVISALRSWISLRLMSRQVTLVLLLCCCCEAEGESPQLNVEKLEKQLKTSEERAVRAHQNLERENTVITELQSAVSQLKGELGLAKAGHHEREKHGVDRNKIDTYSGAKSCDRRSPSLLCNQASAAGSPFFYHPIPDTPRLLDSDSCQPNTLYPFTPAMLQSRGLVNKVSKQTLRNVHRVHEKLQSGSKPVNVVTIGGSMAMGTNCLTQKTQTAVSFPSPACAHGSIFSEWLKVKYPKACVRSVNRAMPGETLANTMSRLASLTGGADILIVDYSANDKSYHVPNSVDAEESFVRYMLQNQPQTVIFLMFSVCTSSHMTTEKGSSKLAVSEEAERSYRKVAQHYEIPFINLPFVLGSEDLCNHLVFPGGYVSGEDENEIHPPWNIHQLIADLVVNAFNNMLATHMTNKTFASAGERPSVLPRALSNTSVGLICAPKVQYDSSISFNRPHASSHATGTGRVNDPTVTHGNWRLFEDRKGKPGWIATDPDSVIEFDLEFSSKPSMSITYLLGYEKLTPVSIAFRVGTATSRSFVIDPIKDINPFSAIQDRTTTSEALGIPNIVLRKLGVQANGRATMVVTLLKPAQTVPSGAKFKLLSVSSCEDGHAPEQASMWKQSCPWKDLGIECTEQTKVVKVSGLDFVTVGPMTAAVNEWANVIKARAAVTTASADSIPWPYMPKRKADNTWPYISAQRSASHTTTNLCDQAGQNIGKWVEGQDEIGQECCGWDTFDARDAAAEMTHFKKHQNICGSERMWTKGCGKATSCFRGSRMALAQIGGHACFCQSNKQHHLRWVPQDCQLLDWNATTFCHHLGNRTILFLGDSTMEQTASVVMNAISSQLGLKVGCQTNIMFARSDQLGPENVERNPHWSAERNAQWSVLVDAFMADVVVVNSGAHVQAFQVWHDRMIKKVLTELDGVKEKYRRAGRHFEFVWMTQPPPGCSTEPKPILDWTKYSWMGTERYNYDQTDDRDAEAKKAFSGVGEILDLTPLKGRPDGHVGSLQSAGSKFGGDCLHWCVPGPITIIPRLILQMMATGRMLVES